MILIVAREAAHARALPPKVEAWLPAWKTSANFAFEMSAPIGTPSAIDLAQVKRSGFTPKFCQPHHMPVRPMPHWTSSQIIRRFFSSQSARTPAMNSGVAGVTPPSPCTASSMIATVLSVRAALTDSRSLKSA